MDAAERLLDTGRHDGRTDSTRVFYGWLARLAAVGPMPDSFEPLVYKYDRYLSNGANMIGKHPACTKCPETDMMLTL